MYIISIINYNLENKIKSTKADMTKEEQNKEKKIIPEKEIHHDKKKDFYVPDDKLSKIWLLDSNKDIRYLRLQFKKTNKIFDLNIRENFENLLEILKQFDVILKLNLIKESKKIEEKTKQALLLYRYSFHHDDENLYEKIRSGYFGRDTLQDLKKYNDEIFENLGKKKRSDATRYLDLVVVASIWVDLRNFSCHSKYFWERKCLIPFENKKNTTIGLNIEKELSKDTIHKISEKFRSTIPWDLWMKYFNDEIVDVGKTRETINPLRSKVKFIVQENERIWDKLFLKGYNLSFIEDTIRKDFFEYIINTKIWNKIGNKDNQHIFTNELSKLIDKHCYICLLNTNKEFDDYFNK